MVLYYIYVQIHTTHAVNGKCRRPICFSQTQLRFVILCKRPYFIVSAVVGVGLFVWSFISGAAADAIAAVRFRYMESRESHRLIY